MMTKKEMIKLYSTILRQWNETIEDQRKKCGSSADEPMYIDASFVTNMLKDIIDKLGNIEDEKTYELTVKSLEVEAYKRGREQGQRGRKLTGAIDFLKHAREMCSTLNCKGCIFDREPYVMDDKCALCANAEMLDDNDIADLIRKVEEWHRERSKDED